MEKTVIQKDLQSVQPGGVLLIRDHIMDEAWKDQFSGAV